MFKSNSLHKDFKSAFAAAAGIPDHGSCEEASLQWITVHATCTVYNIHTHKHTHTQRWPFTTQAWTIQIHFYMDFFFNKCTLQYCTPKVGWVHRSGTTDTENQPEKFYSDFQLHGGLVPNPCVVQGSILHCKTLYRCGKISTTKYRRICNQINK